MERDIEPQDLGNKHHEVTSVEIWSNRSVASSNRSRAESGHRSQPNSRPPSLRLSQNINTLAEKPYKWVITHHQGNIITKHRKEKQGLVSKTVKNLFTGETHREPGTDRDGDVPKSTKNVDQENYRLEVSFAELQRMRLRKLQYELVNHAASMYLRAEEPHDWEVTLQQYIQAFRDYEYMTKAISAGIQDPFVATSEDEVVNWMLNEIYAKVKEWPQETSIPGTEWKTICDMEDMIHNAKSGNSAQPIGGTRRANLRISRLRSFQGRLMTAAVGGIFLVGPMWLMTLHNTRYTALISTSVFVFVFGVLMASSLEKPMDVLSSTAAYAAVLVVFVGTTSPPT